MVAATGAAEIALPRSGDAGSRDLGDRNRGKASALAAAGACPWAECERGALNSGDKQLQPRRLRVLLEVDLGCSRMSVARLPPTRLWGLISEGRRDENVCICDFPVNPGPGGSPEDSIHPLSQDTFEVWMDHPHSGLGRTGRMRSITRWYAGSPRYVSRIVRERRRLSAVPRSLQKEIQRCVHLV
jgi:hypothetical protein